MSAIFGHYAMVDWSAANAPARGKDSIWIGRAERRGGAVRLLPSVNPATRHAAMQAIADIVRTAIASGERLLLGFDFPFGYPRGAAAAIGGRAHWTALWKRLSDLVGDDDRNVSNRFEVGGLLNRTALKGAPMFWGRPSSLAVEGLGERKPHPYPTALSERRLCEDRARGASPVWKLAYPGSVGSQALLGIARLQALTRTAEFAGRLRIWPFETGFADDPSAACVVAEIYPSLFPVAVAGRSCLDEAQVETLAQGFAEADCAGRLPALLAAPAGLCPHEAETVRNEEGWILGLGVDTADLKEPPPGRRAGPPAPQPATAPLPAYLRDPGAIYRASFAAIRAETDLSRFPGEAHDLAIRLVHSCGMTDILDDLVLSPDAVEAGARALAGGAPILCDAQMVAHGVIRARLPARNAVLCRLGAPQVPEIAARLGTTRSAAQVELWMPDLAGAVVAIGNAPTALFALLEALDRGAPRPAVILGFPVGFVGAAESKQELARDPRGTPFATLRGRRGGSALAAAAVNALAAGLP